MVGIVENGTSLGFLCKIHRGVTFLGSTLVAFGIFWVMAFLRNIGEADVNKTWAANTHNKFVCLLERQIACSFAARSGECKIKLVFSYSASPLPSLI